MFTKADIEKYFTAEKNESLAFIIIGVIAIILALVFLFYLKTNWYKGFAIPLIVIALVQFSAGFTVYKKCDEDRKRSVYAYDMNPDEIKIKEIPRMEKVIRNFLIYRYIEIALLLSGLGLFFYYKDDSSMTFWTGLFLALAIEVAITFGGDFIAQKRAVSYYNGLTSFLKTLK